MEKAKMQPPAGAPAAPHAGAALPNFKRWSCLFFASALATGACFGKERIIATPTDSQQEPPSPGATTSDDAASEAASKPPDAASSCVPVYLQGSCFAGCIRVDAPFPAEAKFNMSVDACGLSHKVHTVADDATGARVHFLVPQTPSNRRYGGPVCSAHKPSASMCKGRCEKECDLPDLGQYFVD